jgi:voltage-gated potassium channel
MQFTSTTQVSLRRRLYLALDPTARHEAGLSSLNKGIALLILASVAVAIAESEVLILSGRENLFFWIECAFATAFLIEYSLRIWVCVENPLYSKGRIRRIRYALSPSALLDLMAILPLLLTAIGSEAFLLRLFRLVRILRLAKLGRYSLALTDIVEAIRSRRYELAMSLGIAALLLVISSTLLYMVESEVQPDAFGSIPRAMWWSIATLTTVGYGDVFPTTVIGRILAGITAIIGIGLIAMPTGILAAAFSDALVRRRLEQGQKESKEPVAPTQS